MDDPDPEVNLDILKKLRDDASVLERWPVTDKNRLLAKKKLLETRIKIWTIEAIEIAKRVGEKDKNVYLKKCKKIYEESLKDIHEEEIKQGGTGNWKPSIKPPWEN